MSQHYKEALLKSRGFIVGLRSQHPEIYSIFPGKYVVHYPGDYTKVGDDLEAMLDAAIWLFKLPTPALEPWDDEDPSPPINYVIEQQPERLDVLFENGANVWIEREDGRIRVHCFDTVNDEPLNVEIYEDRIDVWSER